MDFAPDMIDIARVMYANNMVEFKNIIRSWEFGAAVNALVPLCDNKIKDRYVGYAAKVHQLVDSIIELDDSVMELTHLVYGILAIDDSICYLPWNLSKILFFFDETETGFVVKEAFKNRDKNQ
jgi:hypothetical protein